MLKLSWCFLAIEIKKKNIRIVIIRLFFVCEKVASFLSFIVILSINELRETFVWSFCFVVYKCTLFLFFNRFAMERKLGKKKNAETSERTKKNWKFLQHVCYRVWYYLYCLWWYGLLHTIIDQSINQEITDQYMQRPLSVISQLGYILSKKKFQILHNVLANARSQLNSVSTGNQKKLSLQMYLEL